MKRIIILALLAFALPARAQWIKFSPCNSAGVCSAPLSTPRVSTDALQTRTPGGTITTRPAPGEQYSEFDFTADPAGALSTVSVAISILDNTPSGGDSQALINMQRVGLDGTALGLSFALDGNSPGNAARIDPGSAGTIEIGYNDANAKVRMGAKFMIGRESDQGDAFISVLRRSAVVDLPSIPANSCVDTTSGISLGTLFHGDPTQCALGYTGGFSQGGIISSCYTSATGTIFIHGCNVTTGAINPASTTYYFTIWH